jgi:hypothetical protein
MDETIWAKEKGQRTKKAAKQNPLSIWKQIYEESYTLEDGHVGRNIQWKPKYNKAARRRKHNLQ